MRRRTPRWIRLSHADRQELQSLMMDGRTEQRVVRRARVLLAMEKQLPSVDDLATRVEMTRSGIWRLCRRYEQRGIDVVDDAPRSGRPRSISPLGPRADRATRLLRPGRHRPAHDPLVDAHAGQGCRPGG